MRMDERMSAILREIPQNKNLADVGADHGYIGINYALQNKNNFVVGSDISSKSIEKAAKCAKNLGLVNYFTAVGDGLKPIERFAVDVVLISGMGGEEIINIISSAKRYATYVLSPQKNVQKVRKFLSENNLLPTKDYKVFSEGKFYDIIVCEQGEYCPTPFELIYGSGQGKDFCNFAEFTKNRLKSLLEKVGNAESREKLSYELELLEDFGKKNKNHSNLRDLRTR